MRYYEIPDPPEKRRPREPTVYESLIVRPGDALVYFIHSDTGGPIKIGITYGSPLARLADLQTSSPYLLSILAVIARVKPHTERFIHEHFARLRFRGEWFQPDHELLKFITDFASPWEAVAHLWPVDGKPCFVSWERSREAKAFKRRAVVRGFGPTEPLSPYV